MVSPLAFKIIKNACIILIKRGEDGYEVAASYIKLSEEQRTRLLQELLNEGYLK